jgi:hypothetical protein
MWVGEGACLAAGVWPGVARRLVTFFVNATKKVTKENAPRHPRNPVNRSCRVGGKELALLGYFDFCFLKQCSNTFAADPPDRLDFRRG